MELKQAGPTGPRSNVSGPLRTGERKYGLMHEGPHYISSSQSSSGKSPTVTLAGRAKPPYLLGHEK